MLCVIMPSPLISQELTIDLGDDASLTGTTVHLLALITVLSIAPGILMMITCFPFIVTVLSILRQAIGLQQSPPNMLLVTLALFLTYYVMEPTFVEAWEKGLRPFINEEIEVSEAFTLAMEPFRTFMAARIAPDTLLALTDLRGVSLAGDQSASELDLSILVPSFLLSEVERAFEVGFLIFLPFLIIDLVVSAVLMSMGMMMVPPVIVSLPFKLAFFVVADGWMLVSTALVGSYL